MVREGGNEILADTLDAQAEITGKSFVDVFRNEYGYLFDYVDGYMMDWSVRPNMIFTVAFDYSPLDRAQKKQVLDIVTKELLTPKGLRTLSPGAEWRIQSELCRSSDSKRLCLSSGYGMAVADGFLHGSTSAYL